jgi:hypothetical protein
MTYKLKKEYKMKLLNDFKNAPIMTWFSQDTVAAIRDCSLATIERDRWAGTGVPFIKCGRSVRYTKQAILDWLNEHSLHQSTSDY